MVVETFFPLQIYYTSIQNCSLTFQINFTCRKGMRLRYCCWNNNFLTYLHLIIFNVWFTADGSSFLFLFLASKHEPDGRVILVEFETLRLLNTYVPNNGWKEEPNSFQRRRKWDKRILEFVNQNSDKPLIWCGDLNVRWLIFIFLLVLVVPSYLFGILFLFIHSFVIK